VSPTNSNVEALTPNVIKFGGRGYEEIRVKKVMRARCQWLTHVTLEVSLGKK
jgi:hypothetical protein